ncbi:MAG: family 2 glycosyl transferase [Bacteroidetes bacterium OLB10]|nr:MAG: family 2 glycosyl transferase [Bacteroidetes bacterium OLB10]MBX3105239.1 glycosyltransferase [Bacteroidota bacterium]MCB8930112.1 glycosyltransferase [Bacteroidia bacterium]MCW5931010.1 glycosyltransferase [Bacteroidota bacterium]
MNQLSPNNSLMLSTPIPIAEQSWPDGTLPLLSIASLAYNHEAFLRECLDGFLMQRTTFPVRICIFEDCSTDNTASILQEYKEKYPQLFYTFPQPENTWGQTEKRAKAKEPFIEAIHAAKYIAYCECDDYWTDPEKLQLQVSFLENHPEYSMCFTNINHVDKNGKIIRETTKKYKQDTYTHDDLVPLVIPPTLTIVFRKNAIPEKMPEVFNTLKHTDGFFKALVSLSGPVKYFDRVTGNYRVHGSGVYSGASFEEKNNSVIASYTAIANYFTSKKVRQNAHSAISNIHLKLSFYQLRKGRIIPFFKEAYKGFVFTLKSGKLPTIGYLIMKVKNRIKKRKFEKAHR